AVGLDIGDAAIGTEVLEVVVHPGTTADILHGRCNGVLTGADGQLETAGVVELQQLAVDAHDNTVAAGAGLPAEETAAAVGDGELVACIEREVVRDRDAVTRAQRQRIGVAVGRRVFHFGGDEGEIPDGFAADAHGGTGKGIDQGGRDAEQLDVV